VTGLIMRALLGSRLSMPRNTTPLPARSRDAWASIGASARHGPHQEPQTLTTTTLPRKSVSDIVSPSRVRPDTSPGCLRSAALTVVMMPLPAT